MFNMLRFISKSSIALMLIQRPISLVLNKRSIWNVCYRCQQTIILNNKFKCLNLDKRYKRTKNENDDSDDEIDLHLDIDDSSQLVKFRTSTMRMDTLLKHALGKSRNKIELAFYESRIRVNGNKVTKKSHTLEVGDEVDLVKGPSPKNPDFILVSRVEVLSSKLDGDELEVKLRKFKNLLIDNYDIKWKAPS